MTALSSPPMATAAPRTGLLRHDVRDPVHELQALVTGLSIGWDRMDDDAKLALVQEIRRAAADLGQLAGWVSGIPHARDAFAVDGLSRLTPREREVLRAMAGGESTGTIARSLRIGPATVRSHVKSLLAKLGLHSRVEAVALFLRYEGSPSLPSV